MFWGGIYRQYHRGQKTTLEPLELELKALVSQLKWALALKLKSSVEAVQTFNLRAISPAPYSPSQCRISLSVQVRRK